MALDIAVPPRKTFTAVYLGPKLCLGMPMTKLPLVWLIRQAELEGRHSQAELGNETHFAQPTATWSAMALDIAVPPRKTFKAVYLGVKFCLGMPMTKLPLVWLIRQAELEGRHSQAELSSLYTSH
ncbi:MAG: hypothetical protein HOP34_06825 [Methylococcaceae bacterium]|nr:hypothetical protein [Methylococcaceae bacterium]